MSGGKAECRGRRHRNSPPHLGGIGSFFIISGCCKKAGTQPQPQGVVQSTPLRGSPARWRRRKMICVISPFSNWCFATDDFKSFLSLTRS